MKEIKKKISVLGVVLFKCCFVLFSVACILGSFFTKESNVILKMMMNALTTYVTCKTAWDYLPRQNINVSTALVAFNERAIQKNLKKKYRTRRLKRKEEYKCDKQERKEKLRIKKHEFEMEKWNRKIRNKKSDTFDKKDK